MIDAGFWFTGCWFLVRKLSWTFPFCSLFVSCDLTFVICFFLFAFEIFFPSWTQQHSTIILVLPGEVRYQWSYIRTVWKTLPYGLSPGMNVLEIDSLLVRWRTYYWKSLPVRLGHGHQPKSVEFAQTHINSPMFLLPPTDVLQFEPSILHGILLFDVLEHIPLEQHRKVFKASVNGSMRTAYYWSIYLILLLYYMSSNTKSFGLQTDQTGYRPAGFNNGSGSDWYSFCGDALRCLAEEEYQFIVAKKDLWSGAAEWKKKFLSKKRI